MLFSMVMDYLPIQATSVPCEQVFSLSGKTDMKQRNCINPLTMEALHSIAVALAHSQLKPEPELAVIPA